MLNIARNLYPCFFNFYSNNKKFDYRTKHHFARVHQLGRPKNPAPHNIKVTFGSIHVALTRAFVDFTLHNQVAMDFLEWVKDTMIPDETFFQSLTVNPQLGVPGAFTGKFLNQQFQDKNYYIYTDKLTESKMCQ